MRWKSEAPVVWPSDEAWLAWLRHELAGFEDDETWEQDLRLSAGEHLQPGAIYEVLAPGLTVGAAAGGIGGMPGDRTLFAEYREFGHRRRAVTIEAHGLDAPRWLRVESTLAHLGVRCETATDRDRLLDLQVRLDWLLVRVRARVVRRGAGETLVVTVRLVGQGVWRPALAPLLTLAAPLIATGVRQGVAAAADRLSHLEEDPSGAGRGRRELEQRRAGAEIFRRRFHEVVDTVDARPWWRRRGATALREAYADLPAVAPHWPRGAGDLLHGTWWAEEQQLFEFFLATTRRRRDRHRQVDERVDRWIENQERAVESVERAQREAELGDGSIQPELTDEWVDLSWLSSPWSTVRRLMTMDQEAAGDAHPDDPDLATDAGVQRMLREALREAREG